MMLDLGWQGMQSKFWVGVLSFAGVVLFAHAQDYTSPSSNVSKDEAVAAASASDSTGVNIVNGGGVEATVEAPEEGPLNGILKGADGPSSDAPGLPIEDTPSAATVDDNYTPTERISEDRSVSFPVDI